MENLRHENFAESISIKKTIKRKKFSRWTPYEDELLYNAYQLYGNNWHKIMEYLPDRTINGIKGRIQYATPENFTSSVPIDFLSTEDELYIANHVDELTIKELSLKLNKSYHKIKYYIYNVLKLRKGYPKIRKSRLTRYDLTSLNKVLCLEESLNKNLDVSLPMEQKNSECLCRGTYTCDIHL